MFDTSPNHRLVQQFIDHVLNHGDVDALDTIATPDYTVRIGALGEHVGRDAAKAFFAETGAGAFPDLHVEALQVFTGGSDVMVLFSSSGTNSGPILGHPATGRRATWSGATRFRFHSGLIAETTHIEDTLGALLQLGVLNLPAA